jgi:hypothetical protein
VSIVALVTIMVPVRIVVPLVAVSVSIVVPVRIVVPVKTVLLVTRGVAVRIVASSICTTNLENLQKEGLSAKAGLYCRSFQFEVIL